MPTDTPTDAPTAAVAAAATAPPANAGAPSSTVWLCRPGAASDPCAFDRRVTDVRADGSTAMEPPSAPSSHRYDCFYVYPTVTQETTPNADLQIQQAEINAAVLQASQFSQVCDVWAPMYRQITWSGLAHPNPTIVDIAYSSVKAAWDDYLAHDNQGRPVIFLGHSQGAIMLIDLLRAEVDRSPALRHLMVSAIILGGDLTVATGQGAGGAFTNIPACLSPRQVGCVIAYSSFLEQPPANTGFGRPGQGASLLWGETATTGQQVLCVNPAGLNSGFVPLHPLFPTAQEAVSGVSTPWVAFPGLYIGGCQSSRGATWLEVQPTTSSTDRRPRVQETAGPAWGLHADDANIVLGDLIAVVRAEEAAYH